MSYNPFAALQWLLDGKTVAGLAMRGPAETPTREEALRLYTQGSAWFAHEESNAWCARCRPACRPRRAVEGLHDGAGRRDRLIKSLLTMVGGKIVYNAAGPYAAVEEK